MLPDSPGSCGQMERLQAVRRSWAACLSVPGELARSLTSSSGTNLAHSVGASARRRVRIATWPPHSSKGGLASGLVPARDRAEDELAVKPVLS